jgi:hypothetical protein
MADDLELYLADFKKKTDDLQNELAKRLQNSPDGLPEATRDAFDYLKLAADPKELERRLEGLQKLTTEVGEALSNSVRQYPDRIQEATRALSRLAMFASGTWYCVLPRGCIPLDPASCLASGGTPTQSCPRIGAPKVGP